MRPGYMKWKQTGEKLFRGGLNSDIYDLPLTTLVEKKEIGEKWLRENGEHKDFNKQLRRYELICDRIEYLQYAT